MTELPEHPALSDGEKPVIIIKKYANRRLYNTATSSYVTLDNLSDMVRQGQEFTVTDARTAEDLTRQVLAQILYEKEAGGANMLPITFMRQMISLYGDSLQAMVPKYLDASMKAFSGNQERLRHYMKGTMGPFYPQVENLETAARQNMALWEQGLKMLNPFGHPGEQNDLQVIRQELANLHSEIDRLKKHKTGSDPENSSE
jgi:polyhydroxyalkanoate synthesis repressor PhaR